MLARATKERTPLELRPLDRAQKLQGRDVSNKANAAKPKTRTGSEVIDSRSKLPKADDDASSCMGNSALKDQRLAGSDENRGVHRVRQRGSTARGNPLQGSLGLKKNRRKS